MLKKSKEEKPIQKMCPDDASLWVKLRNEPYLLEHPKMMVLSLICGTLLQYFACAVIIFGAAYLMTALIGAIKVV